MGNNLNNNNTNGQNSSNQNETESGFNFTFTNLLSAAATEIAEFPHVSTAGFFSIVAIVSWLVNPSFKIFASLISVIGPIETICFGL